MRKKEKRVAGKGLRGVLGSRDSVASGTCEILSPNKPLSATPAHQPHSSAPQGRWFHRAGVSEQRGWEVGSTQKISPITIHPEMEARRESGRQESKSEAHPCFPAPGNFCLGCQPNVSHGQTLPVLITSITPALNASHPESSPVGSAGPRGQSPENLRWAQVWTHWVKSEQADEIFLAGSAHLVAPAPQPLVLHRQVGTSLTGQTLMSCGPHLPLVSPWPLLLGQGRAGRRHSTYLFDVPFSPLTVWSSLGSCQYEITSGLLHPGQCLPKRQLGENKNKKHKWVNLSWRSRNGFTNAPEGIGCWITKPRKDSPANPILSWYRAGREEGKTNNNSVH